MTRTIWTVATAVWLLGPLAPLATAQDCDPGTLLQWSYGNSFSGGPDLNEPLVTDRPDFTESSVTVGRGVTQLEWGYGYSYDNENGTSVRTHSYPELLARVGVGWEWLELRIGWNYIEERTRTGGVTTGERVGSEDVSLGFKIALTPQEGVLPETALLPYFTIPSGSSGIRNDEVLPGLNYLYSWELNECTSLGGSSQAFMALDETTGDDFVTFAQSLSLGYSVSDRVGSYAEWYALLPSGADTELPQHYFNGGFTYLITCDLQLDVFAGVGLNDAADDYFVGTGGAWRF